MMYDSYDRAKLHEDPEQKDARYRVAKVAAELSDMIRHALVDIVKILFTCWCGFVVYLL